MQITVMIVLIAVAITAMGLGVATLLATIETEDCHVCLNCAEWISKGDGYGICRVSTTATALTMTGHCHCCKQFTERRSNR